MTSRQYGTIGLAGVCAFVVALVALHILDPDLSPVYEYMSVYGLGAYGWLLQVGAILLGFGTIATALGLRATLTPGKRVTASWVLTLIAGLAYVAAGLFKTDPTGATGTTMSGTIHDLAGFVYLFSLLIAAWVLRGVFARDEGYRHLAKPQLGFAILLTVATLILFASPPPGPVGLAQRAFFVVLVTWLFVVAANVRGLGASARASAPSGD